MGTVMRSKEYEPLPLDRLAQFLIKAKRDGYANPDRKFEHEADGSFSTRFEEGDLSFHDNWFGGEPFAGREVVSYQGKPIWMMIYFGDDFAGVDGTVPILKKALIQMPEDMPVRGPKQLVEGSFFYQNVYEGNLASFDGVESIFK